MQIKFTTAKAFARLGPQGQEVEAIDLLVRGRVKQAEKLFEEVAAREPWRKICHRDLKSQIWWWYYFQAPRLGTGLTSAGEKALSDKSLAFARSDVPVLVPGVKQENADLQSASTLRRRTHRGQEYMELPTPSGSE